MPTQCLDRASQVTTEDDSPGDLSHGHARAGGMVRVSCRLGSSRSQAGRAAAALISEHGPARARRLGQLPTLRLTQSS